MKTFPVGQETGVKRAKLRLGEKLAKNDLIMINERITRQMRRANERRVAKGVPVHEKSGIFHYA